MAPKLVLVYLNTIGVGEAIRWALVMSRLEWEDRRLPREEFNVLKPCEFPGYIYAQSTSFKRGLSGHCRAVAASLASGAASGSPEKSLISDWPTRGHNMVIITRLFQLICQAIFADRPPFPNNMVPDDYYYYYSIIRVFTSPMYFSDAFVEEFCMYRVNRFSR